MRVLDPRDPGRPSSLRLTRGPYGGEPCYYGRDGDRVLAASSLAALVDALGVRPALDVEALAAYGAARPAWDPRATVYRGVCRVLPCETVCLDERGARSSFTLPKAPELRASDVAEHARLLRETLDHIVEDAVGAYPAAAVLTGGGLDSSGLLAFATAHARRRGTPVVGAAIDFPAPGDDRPHLRALLAHCGAPALRACPRELGLIPWTSFVQDAAPAHWPTTPMETLAARRAKAWGAAILLTGAGGDTMLDGDLSSFARRIRRGDLRAVSELVRLRTPWGLGQRERLRLFVVNPLLRPRVPATLLSWYRRRHVAGEVHWAGPRLRSFLDGGGLAFDEEQDDWQTRHALSHELMAVADARGQMEVATGMRRVDPYLDPRCVELIARFPPEEMFYGSRLRGLYRHAMKGMLPESLRLRLDKASFEPMIDEVWAQAGLEPLLTMEATADLGLVEPGPFRDAVDRVVQKEPTPSGWLGVWPMIAVEAFVRVVENRAPRAEVRGRRRAG